MMFNIHQKFELHYKIVTCRKGLSQNFFFTMDHFSYRLVISKIECMLNATIKLNDSSNDVESLVIDGIRHVICCSSRNWILHDILVLIEFMSNKTLVSIHTGRSIRMQTKRHTYESI